MSESEEYSGSGTDSEEHQRPTNNDSDSESSGSGSGSEDTETRFMVMKNDANKRARDDETRDTASKKVKPSLPTAGGAAAGKVASPPPLPSRDKGDEPPKPLAIKGTTAIVKVVTKKPTEPTRKPQEKQGGSQRPGEQSNNKPKEEATPKKTPQAWTNEDEQVLVSHILKDMKTGIRPPKRGARGDNYHYWGDLHDACQGRFIADWSKEQLYDKYRRLKSRYDGMVEKVKEEGASALRFKNPGEEKLFNLWKQIYDMQEQDEAEPASHTAPRSAGEGRKSNHVKSAVAAAEEALKKDLVGSSSKKGTLANKQQQHHQQQQHVEATRQNGKAPAAEGNNNNNNFNANSSGSGMASLQEIQSKSYAQLEEIQGKVNQMMSDFQARSQRLVQEARNAGGRVEWLGDWLMMSMARANSPLLGLEMPSLLSGGGLGSGIFGWLGGLWDGNSPAAAKFKEHWLQQQAEELRVMEQRLRLMQELCHHQQELLKQSQAS